MASFDYATADACKASAGWNGVDTENRAGYVG